MSQVITEANYDEIQVEEELLTIINDFPDLIREVSLRYVGLYSCGLVGMSQKSIARDLNISTAAVTELLADACRRLRGKIRRQREIGTCILPDAVDPNTQRKISKHVERLAPNTVESCAYWFVKILSSADMKIIKRYQHKIRNIIIDECGGPGSTPDKLVRHLIENCPDATLNQEWTFKYAKRQVSSGKGRFKNQVGFISKSAEEDSAFQFESGLEKRYLEKIFGSKLVTDVATQAIMIPYRNKGIERKYYPDIVMRTVDGQIIMIEVKPELTFCIIDTFRKALVGHRYAKIKKWGYVLAGQSGHTLQDHMRQAMDIDNKPFGEIAKQIDKTGEPIFLSKALREELKIGSRGSLYGCLRYNLLLDRHRRRLMRVPSPFSWSDLIAR